MADYISREAAVDSGYLRPTGLKEYYWCSECDKTKKKTSNFCPNCGADMMGG